MAVVASATGAAVFELTGVAAGLAGGALLGAGAGALYSGITGDGNILNSALTGGLIGGAVGGLGAAVGPSLMGTAGGTVAPTATTVAGAANTPALASSALTGANTSTGAALANASADPIMAAANMSGATESQLAALNNPATVQSAASQLGNAKPMTGGEMLGYGLAGTAAMSLLGGMNQKKLSSAPAGQNPSMIRPFTYNVSQNQSAYPTTPQYGANGLPILPTKEQNYFNQSYTAGTPYKAANGGLMAAGGITYDANTQKYSGLPQAPQSPLVSGLQLSPDQVSELTPQYQAANPYAYSYDAKTQRYGAATPTMEQLNAFQQQQQAAMQPIQPMQPQDDSGIDRNISGGAAAGGLMHMAKGGKSEDDGFIFDDLTKAQKEYYLNMMDAKFDVPKSQYVEGLGYQTPPPSVNGRLGINMDALGGKFRAGASGMAMQTPDKRILTAPGMMDIGYTSKKESAYDPTFDVSLQRAIKSAPGRGKDYALAANYTMPFAMGGGVDGGLMKSYAMAEGGQINLQGSFSMGSGQQNQPQSANGYSPAGGQPYGPAQFNSNQQSGSMGVGALGGGRGMTNGMGLGGFNSNFNPQATYFEEATPQNFNNMAQNAMSGMTPNPNRQQMASGIGARSAMNNPNSMQGANNSNVNGNLSLSSALRQSQGMAVGGLAGGEYNLGGYSDGGRLLRGPGDGVSDNIPAVIGQKQPARLADGEFVIPARIVSELGNGSTDAGAKRLYSMMDNIQAGRKKSIGKGNVAKDTKAKKHLLA